MRCLIIAAGMGSRLCPPGRSKPLTLLGDMPLIEHVMRNCIEGGVDGFVVAVGHLQELLRPFLARAQDRLGVPITVVVNDDYRRGNGLSVLAARDELAREPFILSMSDHIYEASVVRDLIALAGAQPAFDGLVLAVDKRIDNPDIDPLDVTRVFAEQSRIKTIGKGIEPYNCFDTGVFLCSPAIFDALRGSVPHDESLSAGVRALAADGRAGVFDTGERYWSDVDEPWELGLTRDRVLPRIPRSGS